VGFFAQLKSPLGCGQWQSIIIMHFIGHLILAMTDSAPNPKRFHSPFHVGGLTAPQLACFKGGLTNIYDLM